MRKIKFTERRHGELGTDFKFSFHFTKSHMLDLFTEYLSSLDTYSFEKWSMREKAETFMDEFKSRLRDDGGNAFYDGWNGDDEGCQKPQLKHRIEAESAFNLCIIKE